jgi:hypothetical protein
MIPIQIDLEVAEEINYSLLHNNRALLDKLTLTKLVRERVEAITVEVELCVGAESYPYRRTIPVMEEVQIALSSEVTRFRSRPVSPARCTNACSLRFTSR